MKQTKLGRSVVFAKFSFLRSGGSYFIIENGPMGVRVSGRKTTYKTEIEEAKGM